jgi:hypothetical protein
MSGVAVKGADGVGLPVRASSQFIPIHQNSPHFIAAPKTSAMTDGIICWSVQKQPQRLQGTTPNES